MRSDAVPRERQGEGMTGLLTLFQQVERELHVFVARKTDGDQARAIVQETFLRAFRAQRDASFDPGHSGARAFLFTTASRLVADHYRSPGSQSLSLEGLSACLREAGQAGSLAPVLTDHKARDPLDALIRAESVERVRAALALLPEKDRDALVRFYILAEGTQAEIASALGISVARFNNRLNRARIRLKEALRPSGRRET